jgi:3-dehydroquinate synthase
VLTVPVALGKDSYDIHIAPGLLAQAGEHIPAPKSGRPQVVVTDEHVAAEHLDAFRSGLGREIDAVILPPGEETKSWSQLERLVENLLGAGVERGDHVIALGGGVIGDLTGFAASMTRRGCGFVQIPTTLLAQVDSSVGGKTAINARAGKNLVGAFHQPAKVLIDTAVLATLPDRQLRAGYAEVVKYGLIADAAFFDWCEGNAADLLARDADALAHAVAVSCRAKAAIVAADEKETTGVRALLNLGHTFGHALEAEMGFSDRLLHGEAVAIGMRLAFDYSVRRGLCDAREAVRAREHLDASGLPTAIPSGAANPDALTAHMRQDKKASAGQVPLILARGIGSAFMSHDTDLADVRAFLAEDIERTRTA